MAGKRRRKPATHAGKGAEKHPSKDHPPTARAPKAKPDRPPKPISSGRLWLFRLVAVVLIPVLLLGAVELTLRMTGYGFTPDAIVKFDIDGQAYAGQNSQFSWRFFPPHLAREPSPYAFPLTKANNTCRIFILGASAAMGVPEPTFCFGRILEVMLSDLYPEVTFEVITTAMAAINSHAVLPIARDCANYQPDFFIVYLGNNEVTGPYGAGSVFAPLSGNLSVIRTAIALKGTRLGQLMGNLLGSATSRDETPQMWRGLEMFQNNQIRADDAGLQTVYKHYEQNLEDIVKAGRNSGAAVILCTVGANLKDNPPFGSLHKPDLSETQRRQWDEIYQQGVAQEEAGRHDEANREYLRAAEIDKTYADLQYRLGRCYWTLGQYVQAADRYSQARQQDTLRFRADDQINRIIRDVAARGGNGVQLADTVQTLGQNSPNGIPGNELFYEHVHLNFQGNYLLARLVLDRVERALPEHIKSKRATEVDPLSQEDCARRLAYTQWNRYKIADKVLNSFIKRPPFSNRLYHEELIMQLDRELASLKASITPQSIQEAIQQHRWALEQNNADWVLHWKYGQLLAETLGDQRAAAEQFRWVRDHLPHAWLPYDSLARLLLAMGDLDGAVAQYTKVIQLQPTSGRAHFYLGEALRTQGNIDEATKHYFKAIQWEPDCVPAYNNLARILSGKGDMDKAIELCRRGLTFSPESATLLGSLGTLLARTGQKDAAAEAFQAALKIDPNSTSIRSSLEVLQKTYRQ